MSPPPAAYSPTVLFDVNRGGAGLSGQLGRRAERRQRPRRRRRPDQRRPAHPAAHAQVRRAGADGGCTGSTLRTGLPCSMPAAAQSPPALKHGSTLSYTRLALQMAANHGGGRTSGLEACDAAHSLCRRCMLTACACRLQSVSAAVRHPGWSGTGPGHGTARVAGARHQQGVLPGCCWTRHEGLGQMRSEAGAPAS